MARELINALSGSIECVKALSDAEQEILNEIEPQRLIFAKSSVVFREGEVANNFLLVERGTCFNHRHLEDGSRQIIDLYFPGEVIALGELSSTRHSSGLTTFSDAIILAYDKEEIKERVSRSPALARLFIELISQEQANLTERFVGMSRHCARQRMAHFLLEVQARSSRAVSFCPGAQLPPELSGKTTLKMAGRAALVEVPQILIADVLGLSVVHVNRVLRQFREEGLIRIQSQGIEILDSAGVKHAAGWIVEQTGIIFPEVPSPLERTGVRALGRH